MKNKRVLYIFLSLVAIVCAVLVSSVLFSVKHTSVAVRGENRLLDVPGIESQLALIKGKSIFFIEEDKLSHDIEQAHPYAAVINVERVFPSQVIVHIYQRTEAYAVEIDGNYAAVDTSGKVLAINDHNYGAIYMQDDFSGQKLQNVLLELSVPTDISVGSSIKGGQAAFELFKAYASLGIDEHTFRAMFSSVKMVSAGEGGQGAFARLTVTTRMGAEIEIADSGDRLVQKTAAVTEYLNLLNDTEHKNAKITVYYGTDGALYINGPKVHTPG